MYVEWVYGKNDHYCSAVPEKSQPLGPTQHASFPTGTMDPRVGIFLSLLNTNDGYYFSHIPMHTRSSGP